MPRVTAGRERPRPPRNRYEAIDRALTAASEPPMVTMYDMTRGGPADRFFTAATLGAGFHEFSGASWPCEANELAGEPGEPIFRQGSDVVYRLKDGTLVYLGLGHGWARVYAGGPSPGAVYAAIAAFQGLYPATYLDATDDRVPVTFWMNSEFGPQRRLRMIDASPWETVAKNYPPSIRGELEQTMTSFEPGKGGQLLLWQGEPGTGKTWALRALVSEWLPWAEFHYITDPDAFFVDAPSYMVDVLLADSYEVLDGPSGDVVSEADPGGKWRILILEDTGELLSTNAKEKYGQGLSRLLNVVDGMIGQGLRVLCLVTTNDELGELTPAVRRPGRCASQIVFPPFTAEEASEWLGETVEEGGTVAELYSRRGEAPEEALVAGAWVRIRPNTGEYLEDGSDLALSAAAFGASSFAESHTPTATPELLGSAFAEGDVRSDVVRVASAHADEMVGYGETAWNAETGTVLYVCGDWTDPEPIDADFLAIDGVEAVEHEAEALPGGWWEAEVVHPENPPKWVTEPPEKQEAALAEAVALARRPFGG